MIKLLASMKRPKYCLEYFQMDLKGSLNLRRSKMLGIGTMPIVHYVSSLLMSRLSRVI